MTHRSSKTQEDAASQPTVRADEDGGIPLEPIGPFPTVQIDTTFIDSYREATGLSVDAVFIAASLERDPAFPYARERLTKDELTERQALGKTTMRLRAWTLSARDESLEQDEVPEEEIVSVRALREAIYTELWDASTVENREAIIGSVDERLALASPTYRQQLQRMQALDERCRLTADELRERTAVHLTRADGTVAQSPSEWCAKHGVDFDAFVTSLVLLHRDAMERDLERVREERARIAEERGRLEEERAKYLAEKRRPLPVRAGKAFLVTLNATPDSVNQKRRKARGLAGVDEEAERLFLSNDYRPLGAYERAAIVGLANLAWDLGVLEGLDAAKMERRIIRAGKAAVEQGSPRVRIPLPSFPEIARRAGAQPDSEGRIPQHYTRAMERAVKKLSSEPRLIPEPVTLLTEKGAVDTFAVRSALWIEWAVVPDSGEEHAYLLLDVAACTAMLQSWVARPLLAEYERAREASGAKELRDDLVALEDYLVWRRNIALGKRDGANRKGLREGRGKQPRLSESTAPESVEVPAPLHGATEADRVVPVEVEKSHLWKRMGWAKEAEKRGRKVAQQRENEGFAFCRARGILVKHEERDGEKGKVLVLTLSASTHPDPEQGTLFLPRGEA